MSKGIKDTIEAKGFAIQIYTEDFKNEYISLTDIARYKSDEPFIVINNWLRSKENIQFLGLWESMHNPDFKPIEFDRFRNEAGSNAFTLSPQKWIEKTKAIGIVSKSGRYGGTFAHTDIAMEFASWVSPEFKLYIIQDYKRLKSDENSRLSLGWNLNREISKINYKIHTDAIKEYLLRDPTNEQLSYKYASEADIINVAYGVELFKSILYRRLVHIVNRLDGLLLDCIKVTLVIDDIYTTGATVDSIARLLKAAGVSRADVMTFAAGADMVKEAV